jgi:hypothetical protein
MLTPILAAYPLETMRAGDAYWFNDPYLSDGAVQHHQDMVFVVPVFHDGRLVAFAATLGHYQDIGGLRAGSISPHATEVYHEGVLVPPPSGSRARAGSTRKRTGLPSALASRRRPLVNNHLPNRRRWSGAARPDRRGDCRRRG